MKLLRYLEACRERRWVERHRPSVQPLSPDDACSIGGLLDAQVAQQPDAVMTITEDDRITWRGLQELSYRVADLLLRHGVRKGDAVALMMDNSIFFLACVIGITRVGGVVGLLNTQIGGRQLSHCLREVGGTIALADAHAAERIAGCGEALRQTAPDGLQLLVFGTTEVPSIPPDGPLRIVDGQQALARCGAATPAGLPTLRAGDLACYVFTSGTTGYPKAARITHGKFVYGAMGMALFGLHATPHDRLYNCLPLYHGTGLMVGFGACLHSGASMFLRRRFSATHLVEEVRLHRCNMLVYVGEVCRYLLNTPERAGDRRCGLERAIGNGLRPDIWKRFKKRFGIRRVAEFYSASESVGGFMNALNKEGTIGFTSSVMALVRFDPDLAVPIRGLDGRLMPVADGEPGLLVFEVNQRDRFDGYRNADQSETKLIRDAFAEGDCWYNSGDVLRQVEVPYDFGLRHFQFVDRLGDTFRWKSENVSTNEVAEALCAFPGIDFACVYGVAVTGSDGKAGMATLQLAPSSSALDLDALVEHLERELPPYARPLFLRVVRDLEFTGTHKLVKGPLVAQGYDPGRITDPLYVWDPAGGRYETLTAERHARIATGTAGL